MKKSIFCLICLFLLYSLSIDLQAQKYFQSYLICGPFDKDNLKDDCVKNEAGLEPKEGMKTSGKEWSQISSKDGILDFEQVNALGVHDNCVGFAYVKVKSSRTRKAAILLGSDDGVKVYVNGKALHENDVGRTLAFDEDKVDITLNEGWNHLLFKVKDSGGGWMLAARIVDEQGKDIDGLEYFPVQKEAVKIVSAQASTEQVDGEVTLKADNVFDGKFDTRWGSEFEDNQWIILELSRAARLKVMAIHWENAFPKHYEVQVSMDKKQWKTVYKDENFSGGAANVKLKGEEAKYLKINCIKRNTDWGNSIWEVFVFE